MNNYICLVTSDGSIRKLLLRSGKYSRSELVDATNEALKTHKCSCECDNGSNIVTLTLSPSIKRVIFNSEEGARVITSYDRSLGEILGFDCHEIRDDVNNGAGAEEWVATADKACKDTAELHGEINLKLLHRVKLLEAVVEVGVQFVVQLINTVVLNGEGSTAYILSLCGTIFDLVCSIYRYAYHKCKGMPIEDASTIDIRLVEEFFIEKRMGFKDKSANQEESTVGDCLKRIWAYGARRVSFGWKDPRREDDKISRGVERRYGDDLQQRDDALRIKDEELQKLREELNNQREENELLHIENQRLKSHATSPDDVAIVTYDVHEGELV